MPEGVINPEEEARKQETLEKIGSSTAYYIDEARKFGIPEDEIEARFLQVAEENIMNETDSPATILKIMGNMRISTRQRVEEVVRKACEKALLERPSNMVAAEYLFGLDSEEYKRAKELRDKELREEQENEERERGGRVEILTVKGDIEDVPSENDATINESRDHLEALLSEDTTLKDLFNAMNYDLSVAFWLEIHDQFSEVVDRLMELENSDIKVLDFFDEFGYDKSDLEVFLPIRFR